LRAGLDPELDSPKVGVESINYLCTAYEKSIDLRIAAAEYGLPRPTCSPKGYRARRSSLR
jgi:hypothetical protein